MVEKSLFTPKTGPNPIHDRPGLEELEVRTVPAGPPLPTAAIPAVLTNPQTAALQTPQIPGLGALTPNPGTLLSPFETNGNLAAGGVQALQLSAAFLATQTNPLLAPTLPGPVTLSPLAPLPPSEFLLGLDQADLAYLRGLLPAADFAQPGMVPPHATSGRLDGGDGRNGLAIFQMHPLQMTAPIVRADGESEDTQPVEARTQAQDKLFADGKWTSEERSAGAENPVLPTPSADEGTAEFLASASGS
jgi:hypothetical protein